MSGELFLAVAIVLQVAAAVMALRLTRETGRTLAWLFISIALCIMSLRRIIPFVSSIAWQHVSPDPVFELLGMLLSGFMLAGIILIRPIFEKIYRAERELEESERRFRSCFELPIVGFAIASKDRRWLTVNDRLCEMLAVSQEEIIGTFVDDKTYDEDRTIEKELSDEALSGTIDGYVLDKRLYRGSGRESIWVNQAARCVRDAEGNPNYFILILQDISDRKAYEQRLRGSLEEKEVLLRELYHRTKNNMQVICSLLSLEGFRCKDPEIAEEFHEIEGRIQSMSLVHERLYKSNDLARIELAGYINELVALLTGSHRIDPERIHVSTELDTIYVPVDIAIPCGMIMHEIISNSLKHAFPEYRDGRLDIKLKSRGTERVYVSITDNGVGKGIIVDPSKSEGMGLRTVFALADQIGGEVRFSTESGMCFEMEFSITGNIEVHPKNDEDAGRAWFTIPAFQEKPRLDGMAHTPPELSNKRESTRIRPSKARYHRT
jgi:PAS domain S-box-containing protein